MSLDVERIRAAYPALAEGFAHFDGAGGSQTPAPVIDAIAGAMRTDVSNRGTAFEPARRSGEIVAAARGAVADLVGGDPGGVVFGPSATALTYLAARTLSATWHPGDEIVVTRLDHDANVRPWVQAAAAADAVVRVADVDLATGELPVAQFKDLIGDRTRLVALTAASNAIGTMPAVREIADLAHAAGALVYVDGVHATAHVPIDVRELGADFYVTSAYKWSGPHYAALIADPAVLETLSPVKLMPSSDQVPDRFEYGTLSFELLAGVTAAVDHLAGLAFPPFVLPAGESAGPSRRERVLASMGAVAAYERGLFSKLAAGLETIPAVTVLKAPERSCPTISFRIAGQSPSQTARALGEQRLCVSNGDYYAFEYFTAAGLRESGGAVRASLYHYNSADEVDRLLDAISRLG